MALLLLLPPGTDSWSPKSILWLIRLKNMKFYNMNDGLFTPSAVSADLDSKCQQYDRWLDPLRGSTPAVDVPEVLLQELPASWQQTVVDTITQEDLVRIARETIPVLVRMLDTYQERPSDVYRILTTYARILHYYGCILNDEHNKRRSLPEANQYAYQDNHLEDRRLGKGLDKRTENALWNLIGNSETQTVQKRVHGIDSEENFGRLGQSFYQMLGHVFLTLPDTSAAVVRTLTIEHDVHKAITKMGSSESIAVRVYYRAMLCLELNHLLVAITDQQSWQSANQHTQPEVSVMDLLQLEDRLKQKIKLENQLLKELEGR